jgi:deazaflavin-dependent oxidoreductase (nitroreductase family)
MTTTAETIATLASTRTINLTTVGRKTGQPRTIEIWWFRIDGRFMITGTPGRRDWYENVLNNPNIVVSTSIGRFPGIAVPIENEQIRRAVFTDASVSWYATQAELDRLVNSSPMVEIDLHIG